MKRGKQKVKLTVQPLYSMIIWLILLLSMLALLIFPNILWEAEELLWKIAFNVCISFMALICAYSLLQITQIAIISETGIIIKNIFGNIAWIEWKMIVSMTIEKLVTYDSRGYISLNWIVIRTDNSQTANKCAKNKKNIAPWQIKANKKNIAIIKAFLEHYRPDLCIKNN